MAHVVQAGVRSPRAVRAINAVGRVGRRWGFDPPSLDEASLLNRAQRRSGLSDFGGEDFREGLHVLLTSLGTEADLSTVGRVVAFNAISRLLESRLRIEDAFRRHPEINDQPIAPPLVIAGLPRTGTSILQQLLVADPQSRFMSFTQGALPVPPVTGVDKRHQQVAREMDLLCKMVPGFRAIHDMGADLPQECVALMALNFTSVQFELTFQVPSYREWYLHQDLTETMRYHRRVLQLLQFFHPGQGDRWVLKTPPYVSAIEPLLAVYPDAQIIQTHRDPGQVIASVSSLYFALHRLTCQSATADRVGAAEFANWALHLDRNLEIRRRLNDADATHPPIYDAKFDDLLSDPLGVVQRIYQHFGLTWSGELARTMQRTLSEHERNKHGIHSYSAQMYGLDPAELGERFAPYRDYFGVTGASA